MVRFQIFGMFTSYFGNKLNGFCSSGDSLVIQGAGFKLVGRVVLLRTHL
jgi:hypothetical protein